ncbi:hypothetical protein GCM10007938_24750 [Vibrio zhanjiangensis]|uniref:Uncharacterized protein n=1 Tax=Vibrio zhanjiangensis TaxID=1046128 RepID=A0ABQ6F137_9VIBR|nr:hypothetical protein [Vibrio zhanjiangensis]GLT18694.1 hypothetical protein GCM10007938_24750 [Vibrio zhanjiangensis]
MNNNIKLTQIELLGIPDQTEGADEGLTLSILTQCERFEAETLCRNLRTNGYPKAEVIYDIKKNGFELLNAEVYENEYQPLKIKTCIENLTRGVEIFVVDRNLGFDQDLPVFDSEDEGKLNFTKLGKETSWILSSDEFVIGEGYKTCPETITYKKTCPNDHRVRTLSYCKNDNNAIITSILTAAYITRFNPKALRDAMYEEPLSEEHAKTELENLILHYRAKSHGASTRDTLELDLH